MVVFYHHHLATDLDGCPPTGCGDNDAVAHNESAKESVKESVKAVSRQA